MTSATILVVDDDALIVMNTVDMLGDLGHVVLEAYSGREALKILGSDQVVDVLLTDYSMPGMTGLELIAAARDLRPGLPALMTSGHSELPEGVVTDVPQLGKPYSLKDLISALEKLLAPQ